TVWNLRSFDQQQDLYVVRQEIQLYWSSSQPFTFGWTGSITNQLNGVSNVIQPTPDTTECSVSMTSGVSYSAGGGLGWNQTQGLTAILSGGLSISDSQTINCPQIIITNLTNPGTAETAWQYKMPPPQDSRDMNQRFVNEWIWTVPFSSYGKGQTTAQISSAG